MNPHRIRTLIVDDEPLARAMLRSFLAEDAEIEVIGECGDGYTAIEMIESAAPDLVFLDIQMPDLDGFGVLRALAPAAIPNIAFVTAYDQFALKAFDVHAIDYLLKPFDRERFERTLARAKHQIALQKREAVNEELLRILNEQSARPQPLKRILVKSGDKAFFVRPSEISWIEAQGNYVALHVGAQSFLLRQTINTLEKQLDPAKFQRIQRSAIVNLDAICQMHPAGRGEHEIVLKGGVTLKLSHTYRESFLRSATGAL
ncbi:MAG: LytTR family DNA-binding domain-containing protein [Terracidiphilus sp.]